LVQLPLRDRGRQAAIVCRRSKLQVKHVALDSELHLSPAIRQPNSSDADSRSPHFGRAHPDTIEQPAQRCGDRVIALLILPVVDLLVVLLI
jgi:hypothetical protein